MRFFCLSVRFLAPFSRTEGKIEDRSENRMRFSERSRICLCPEGAKTNPRFFLLCPPKIYRIFGGPDLCRRKSQAIIDGRGAFPPIRVFFSES